MTQDKIKTRISRNREGLMLASEALFEGHPVAHIVTYEEFNRLKRIADTASRVIRDRRHHNREI